LNRRWLFVFATAVAVVVACSVDALDLAGKQCPCTDGFVCDTTTNTCVTSLPIVTPDAGGGEPDVVVPKPDAAGAITVLNFLQRWETANGVRWEWQAIGDPAKFKRYEIVTGPRAEDVRARAQSTRVYDPTTNPELGMFSGRSADAGVPATLWAVTDGHKQNEIVFAQVIAYDTNDVASASDIAQATTSNPRNAIGIYADARPDGGVFVPSVGTKIVNDGTGYDASFVEHTVACQGPPPCAIETGVSSIDGLVGDAISSNTEFGVAFLELAVRGTNVPGEFIDVVLYVGQDACGTACRMRFNGLSFGKQPGDWRLLQIPLGRFRGEDGTGTAFNFNQLSNRKRIGAFLVGAESPDGAKISLDQARIRW
jgi:hypothetical protein